MTSPGESGTPDAQDAREYLAVEYGGRQLPGPWIWIVGAIALSWSLFQLIAAAWLVVPSEILRSVHLAFALALVYCCYPALKPRGLLGSRAAGLPLLRALVRRDRPPVFDLVVGGAAVLCALYYVLDYEGLAGRTGELLHRDVAFGIALILLLLEAARRALGPALPCVALGFILLSFASEHLGPVAWKSVSITQVVNQVAIGTEGILGIPLRVSANVVFLFVLLGSLLDKGGAGAWFIRLAVALVGGFKGGAAKAAVLASGLTGIVSGSSIANTVTTGTFTIPLMKQSGYPATKAGAIEVAASTNGQLMPPIMGAAAFLIAEYCQLPFAAVIAAAALPAILSYLALVYITHLEACKLGLAGIPTVDRPRLLPTLREGLAYFPPLIVLLWLLVVERKTPQFAAFYGILTLIGIMLLRPLWAARRGERGRAWGHEGRAIVAGLIAGARNMAGIGVAVAAAGIIVGVVNLGLGGKIVELVAYLSAGNLILLLLMTAIASLILGMGLPTTANYIVMSTLTVPIIMQQGADMGLIVPAIAAHLFCFYFGILADDTPPVGLAAYAAAAISRADPIRTGIQGFVYDLRTAILPFAFLFNTELLMLGISGFWHGALVAVTGLAAMLAFANATQGWLLRRCGWGERILLLVVVAILLRPGLLADWRPATLTWLPELPRWSGYVLGIGLYAAIWLVQGLGLRTRPTSPGEVEDRT